jgi:hypothetical protein
MKSLSNASFFRSFDLLVGETNPGQKLDDWKVDDVQFERERHSFSGRTHCYVIDVFTVFASRPPQLGTDRRQGVLVGGWAQTIHQDTKLEPAD